MRRVQLEIEGLSAFRAVDKLVHGGICVLSAQKTQKNALLVDVAGKDVKKCFAILRASCYNVKKVRFRGLSKLAKMFAPRWGIAVGIFLFFLVVPFAQSRILKINVVGSGAYYREEIACILSQAGLTKFSSLSGEHAEASAQILALPRVSYCSIHGEGGILTVEVQVSDEAPALARGALRATYAGTVEELTVIRGTPCVNVGDEVAEGQILVSPPEGEEIVIASAKVSFCLALDYEGEQEGAILKAQMQYPTAEALSVERVEGTWYTRGIFPLSMNVE